MQTVNLRWIQKDDMQGVLLAEREMHYRYDYDFEMKSLDKNAWQYSDFTDHIRQIDNVKKKTFDTRTLVAEIIEDEGENTEKNIVCGVFIYELYPDKYLVNKITVNPNYDVNHIVRTFIRHMEKKADNNKEGKKTVVFQIIDGDYDILKVFQDYGFKDEIKFIPRKYESDIWQCTYESEVVGHSNNSSEDDNPGILEPV